MRASTTLRVSVSLSTWSMKARSSGDSLASGLRQLVGNRQLGGDDVGKMEFVRLGVEGLDWQFAW